ncbi:MAG: hypothetical protein NT080_03615 [Spirochaetes bacterium]|nr:hypothetical protein [Spirochaetota bacterium]
MGEINMSMSRKSFRELVKHVVIGNWVLTAFKSEEDSDEDEELMSLVLDCARTNDALDGVEYDNDENRLYLDAETQAEFLEHMEAYDDGTFWDELTEELAKRDLRKKYGEEAITAMSEDEAREKLGEERARYEEEFEKYGVERMEIRS